MGKLTVEISDELDKQVRVKIAKSGGKHGALKKAVEEALKLWVEAGREKKSS